MFNIILSAICTHHWRTCACTRLSAAWRRTETDLDITVFCILKLCRLPRQLEGRHRWLHATRLPDDGNWDESAGRGRLVQPAVDGSDRPHFQQPSGAVAICYASYWQPLHAGAHRWCFKHNIHIQPLVLKSDSPVAFWYVQDHRNGRLWVQTPAGTSGASKTATEMAHFSIMWQGPPIFADKAFPGC